MLHGEQIIVFGGTGGEKTLPHTLFVHSVVASRSSIYSAIACVPKTSWLNIAIDSYRSPIRITNHRFVDLTAERQVAY